MKGTFEVYEWEQRITQQTISITRKTVQSIIEYSVQNHLPSITENF